MNQGTHFSGQPILAQILNLVPRAKVLQLAQLHDSDRYYKKFKTYDHLVAMLYTIFSRCTSIREVVTGMLACEHRLRHAGVSYTPRRSTLSDANRRRDFQVFEAIYRYLYRRYAASLPDSCSEKWFSKLYIVDSTTISLFQEILKNAGPSALNGKRKGGVKAHTLIKADEDVPHLVSLTAASTSDRTFMKEIQLPPGSIVAFDRAYVNFEIFNKWTAQGISFVSRLKSDAAYDIVESRSVEAPEREKGVEEDTEVILGHRYHTNKVKARLVVYTDQGSKRTFTFLTNNFDLAPSTIARIYQKRWQIELLFRRIKQNYPLRYFLGDNVNAIKVQIWCALIADLLLNVIHRTCKRSWAFANLSSMVRLHLMTYIDLGRFLNNPERALLRLSVERGDVPELNLFPT